MIINAIRTTAAIFSAYIAYKSYKHSKLDANSLFSGLWPGIKLNTWDLFSFIKYSRLNIKNSFEETLSCEFPKSLRRQLFIEKYENNLLAKLLIQYV